MERSRVFPWSVGLAMIGAVAGCNRGPDRLELLADTQERISMAQRPAVRESRLGLASQHLLRQTELDPETFKEAAASALGDVAGLAPVDQTIDVRRWIDTDVAGQRLCYYCGMLSGGSTATTAGGTYWTARYWAVRSLNDASPFSVHARVTIGGTAQSLDRAFKALQVVLERNGEGPLTSQEWQVLEEARATIAQAARELERQLDAIAGQLITSLAKRLTNDDQASLHTGAYD